MTKEVLVTISGLQFSPETESESVELITSGSQYKKNTKHYIIYDEVNEGFSETTRNIIKLNDDFMDITRSCLLYTSCSTSKITFPGSGVAAIATSANNLEDIKKQLKVQTLSLIHI